MTSCQLARAGRWPRASLGRIQNLEGEKMRSYLYIIEAIVTVEANTEEEARELLPKLPAGSSYVVNEELSNLLREEAGE